MTLRGLFCLALEAFLLIMALGTTIKEFLVLAACIGGLLLYSLLSLLLAVITLDFQSQTDMTDVYRGEEIKYTMSIRGPVILPIVGRLIIRTADNGDITPKSNLRHSFLLVPILKLKRDYHFDMLCAHTGVWKVGTNKMRITDIFGLFNMPLLRTRFSMYKVRINVLPEIHNFDEAYGYIDASKGFTGTAFLNAENGELLGDSRVYREGDTMRRINWKQTARMKKLFTRMYEMPETPKVLIAVDNTFLNDNMGFLADISREVAVSLGSYYLQQGDEVTVVPLKQKGKEAIEEKNYEDFHDIITLQYDLTELEYVGANKALELFRLDDGVFTSSDRIFIITPNPSEGTLGAMADAAKFGKTVVCIVPQLGEEPIAAVKTAVETTGIMPIFVSSPDKIAEKVGGEL